MLTCRIQGLLGHFDDGNGEDTESDGENTESDGEDTESDGEDTESDVEEVRATLLSVGRAEATSAPCGWNHLELSEVLDAGLASRTHWS